MTAWTHCARCPHPMTEHDQYGRCPQPEREPERDAAAAVIRALFSVFKAVIIVVVVLFVLRWAYTEYYIATHCTDVLGTRVCQ